MRRKFLITFALVLTIPLLAFAGSVDKPGDYEFQGDVKIGDGTPSVTQDGEDFYVEGTIEGDGAVRFDNSSLTLRTVAYTLPSADGSNGQQLTTDGSGALSWASASTASPAGSDTQIQYNNGGSFGAISSLIWDDTNVEIADDVRFALGTNADYLVAYEEADEDNLIIQTAATSSSGADNGMVTVAVDTGNSGVTANQEIFEIGKGDQDDGDANFTELLALDEDGDLTVVGDLTLSGSFYQSAIAAAASGNVNLSVDAAGTGSITIAGTSTGLTDIQSSVDLGDSSSDTVSIEGTIDANVTLDDGTAASPSLILKDATDETVTISKADAGYTSITTVAGDGVSVLTGNLKVGNGSAGTASMDGEDFYCEGESEFDGAIQADGAITLAGGVTISAASPSVSIKDSSCTDSDVNASITVAATDTGSGSEDADVTIAQQIAGTSQDVVTVDADGDITLGYGTQDVVSTADVTVTGSDLSLGTAGVKLTGDGDGAVTLSGLGDGEDEDLKINLDDTADTAVVTSSTSLSEVTLSSIALDASKVQVSAASPLVEFFDSDASAGDVNAKITIAATDTGDGSEDIDVTLTQQVAGSDVDFLVADADGDLTLDSGSSIVMTDTVTFSGGQTKKVLIPIEDIELDGSNPPTVGQTGTDAQAVFPSLQFDADGGANGDDIAYLHWIVPEGYVVDSANLNIAYSFSTAEDAADEAQFDFTVNAVDESEALDAAGTALADQTTVISDASADNGKLHISQYDIEQEIIAVGDLVTVEIAVDESASALAASGTLDVLYCEIEYESTE